MTTSGWTLQSGTRQFGPMSEDEMRAYFRAGMVKANDVVHAPGREAPLTAAEAADELGMPAPPPLPVAPTPYEPPRKPAVPVAPVTDVAAPAPVTPSIAPPPNVPLAPPPPTSGFKVTERGPDARWPIVLWVALLFGLHLYLVPRVLPAQVAAVSNFAVLSFAAIGVVAAIVFVGFAQLAKAIRTRPPRAYVALAAITLAYLGFGARELIVDTSVDPAGHRVAKDESLAKWDRAAADMRKRGDYAALLELSQRWIREHREDVYGWAHYGEALGELERYPESLRAHEHAMQLAPDQAWTWTQLGGARMHVGDTAGAVAAYEHGLKLDSRDPVAWNNLGNAYNKLGRIDDQVRAYERAVAIDPTFQVSWKNLARIYGQQGRVAKAAEAQAKYEALAR